MAGHVIFPIEEKLRDDLMAIEQGEQSSGRNNIFISQYKYHYSLHRQQDRSHSRTTEVKNKFRSLCYIYLNTWEAGNSKPKIRFFTLTPESPNKQARYDPQSEPFLSYFSYF